MPANLAMIGSYQCPAVGVLTGQWEGHEKLGQKLGTLEHALFFNGGGVGKLRVEVCNPNATPLSPWKQPQSDKYKMVFE